MGTYNVRVGNAEYEVDAPDETTAWKWANATHVSQPDKPEETASFQFGRQLPTWAQATLKAGDVLSSGLAKRMAGPQTTEMVRGATTQFGEQHPALSFGTELAGTIPQAMIAPEAAIGRAVSIPAQIGRAGIVSGVQGGLAGLGESNSQTGEEALQDVFGGAAKSAALGTGILGVGKTLGAVAGPIARRGAAALPGAQQLSTVSPAQRRLALELSRSVPEGYAGTPSEYGLEQLQKLGPEATLADIGKPTQKLADLLASMPGKAKQEFESLIEQRQAGRAGRLMQGAESASGKSEDFAATIDALSQQKIKDSEPFYNALKYATVPVDDELKSMLQRAGKEAIGKSRRLARLAGEDPIALQETKDARDSIANAIIPGKQLNFRSLDQVKQSLYDLESKFSRAGENQEAAAFGKLRRELTDKLDELSPKDDAGVSIYAKARNAYAGPAQMQDAVELGREAFTKDAVELKGLLGKMSDSEKDAFKIGAMQALRKKTGKEAGQTELLKYWKEPETANALKRIFGDDFDSFASTLNAERSLKELESVGRGSQTFGRQSANEDLGAEMALEGGKAIASGQPWSVVASLTKAVNKAALPENVRNQLAKMLTQRGQPAESELKLLDQVMKDVAKSRARRAALAGALGTTAAKQGD
jgi:hypothetical protein